jgi:hypothetical protein
MKYEIHSKVLWPQKVLAKNKKLLISVFAKNVDGRIPAEIWDKSITSKFKKDSVKLLHG